LIGGSLISLVIAWAIFSGAALLVQRIAPLEWLSSESYLHLVGDSGTTFPWISFYAAIQYPSMILFGLVALGWIAAMINLVQVYLFSFSRVLVAWADDHVMPEIVGYVHPNSKSPVVAILIIAGLMLIGLVNTVQGIDLPTRFGGLFLIICAQLVPVAAVSLYPFLKRDWFASASRIVRLKVGPAPVITIVGLLTLVYLGWLIVYFSLHPNLALAMNAAQYELLGGIILSGLAWYWIRASFLKRAGINLNDNFKKLPDTE
jgi:amino acid transporter